MKYGRKDMTSDFGRDAEFYTKHLFRMMKNPNGSRRPDLISVDGNYGGPFSMEVKSGRQKKGVLNEEQLHYAITTWKDYNSLFGEEMDIGTLFPGEKPVDPKAQEVPYYYDVIDRVDGLASEDISRQYSSIKIRWGDQYIVPHEYAFYTFAVARVMRTEEKIDKVIKQLKKQMKKDALHIDDRDYEIRRTTQSWQNLNGRDIMAVFSQDETIATPQGRKRIELLSQVYADYDKLQRVQIPGPNGTSIYVLSAPGNYNLFNENMRRVVEETTPFLEYVSREREKSISLLEDLVNQNIQTDIFSGNGHPKVKYKVVSGEDRLKLLKLTQWEDPADDIPF